MFLVTSAQPCCAAPLHSVHIQVDVLTDTSGADINAYVHDLTTTLRKRWNREASHLSTQKGEEHRETIVELTLGKDGSLLSLRQEGTESDEVSSRAAWEAVKNNAYPALPRDFRAGALRLRLHFVQVE